MRKTSRSNLQPWHHFVCLLPLAILPVSLTAQDGASAILQSNGGVLLNNAPAPPSSALYPNDLIETQKNAVARITATGSAADINSETIIQFQAAELALDHGSISVDTSRGMRVRVGCMTITPVSDAQSTRYDVSDLDGKVIISAVRGDVYVGANAGNPQSAKQSSRITVHSGERMSFSEKCGATEIHEAARVPGIGAILNSPWAVGTGAAAITVLTCWALCFNNGNPVSPKDP